MRKALADLPKTLDETYSRILCSIPEESIDDVLKMLQWLVYSQRPLSVMELAEVVAINTNGDPWVDADARFPEPSDVFTILSSLVTTEDDASKLKTQRVRFAHFSVKEYLVSDRILLSKAAGKFAIRDTTARKYLAEATCAYLLHLADCDDERELSECQVDYPLLIYVSSKWVQHLLLLGKDEIPRELLMRLLLRIELPRTVYIDILVKLSRVVSRDMLNEIMDDGDDDEVLVKRVLQRQLARVFKKVAKSRILIRSVLVGNNGDAPVCHPLGFAAWAGDLELVQELLKNGHDINVQVRQYGGTLNAALEGFADEDLLQLLLANGSDVNARHECYPKMTPLHTAVSRRNKPAVRLLLQNGANVNSDSDKGSPLHIALKDGGLDISRLLLQHGADVHNDLLDRAPLLTVLPSRIEYSDLRSVVELLLEYGADVNVVGAHGDTALCLSLQRDYAVITDLLLAHGADVNSHAENGDTALLIAVYKGNKTHTQKLLERGADINAKGSSGTVITVACERGSDDMVQLLLDWGAEATFEEDFMGLRYWQPGSAAKDGRKS